MTVSVVWPANCPPNDATDVEGEVFRIVKVDPCVADDFASYAEEGKCPTADACKRCGLSVYRRLADAIHAAEKYPTHGNLIARGTLSASHGKIKQTGSPQGGHHTWWARHGIERHGMFEVVEAVKR